MYQPGNPPKLRRVETKYEEQMIYENILGTIGNTPVVKINKLAPAGTTV